MMGKLKSIYSRFFRKKICADCKAKLDRHFGLKHRIIHKARRAKYRVKNHTSRSKKKLSTGIHWVKIRGKKRKVKVLSSGKWRFMKSR